MLDSLRHFLHLTPNHPEEEENQLDTVIHELSSGIDSVKNQLSKISNQEHELLQKLQGYEHQYQQKLSYAKHALRSDNKLAAEGYYKESEILKGQINQYQRIVREIQETKRKLLAQESQFVITKDELSAKRTLGEANVDASQLKAELSEQLMYLDESDALTKFDELIQDATYKSQAIEEIQGSENSFDHYLKDSEPNLNGLEQIIQQEHEEKVRASQRNQQILIEKVFGKTEVIVDQAQKNKQGSLLNQLKAQNDHQEKQDRVDVFFKSTDKGLINKPTVQDNKKDQEERIKNFFK